MLNKTKSIFQIIGEGLAHQNLWELSPANHKIAQIEELDNNGQNEVAPVYQMHKAEDEL